MNKRNNKRQEKMKEKAWKNTNEAKFEKMVAEYHNAKAELDSLKKDSDEYTAKKKQCDSLFASAERFFTQNQ